MKPGCFLKRIKDTTFENSFIFLLLRVYDSDTFGVTFVKQISACPYQKLVILLCVQMIHQNLAHRWNFCKYKNLEIIWAGSVMQQVMPLPVRPACHMSAALSSGYFTSTQHLCSLAQTQPLWPFEE